MLEIKSSLQSPINDHFKSKKECPKKAINHFNDQLKYFSTKKIITFLYT